MGRGSNCPTGDAGLEPLSESAEMSLFLWMVQVTVCGAKAREATSCLFLLPGVQPLLWMKTFEGWRGIAQLLVSGSVAGAAVFDL